MKRIIFIVLISNITYAQTPLNDPHWQIFWEDDFNFFDPLKWIKADLGNHFVEPTLFLQQNVNVSGGNLILKVDNNPSFCPLSPPPAASNACGVCVPGLYNYTGGWVENTSPFNIQYGYIEAKIKFPMVTGLWPAFWTYLGTNVTAVNAAEIDIAEFIGDLTGTHLESYADDNIVTTNIHYNYDGDYFFSPIMMSSTTNWHKYAVEWSPGRIIWYIDDYPVRLFPNHSIIDPVRIILGSGVQTKKINGILYPADIVSSITFPQIMYVDYVKVYSLIEDCNDFINATQYDFSSYNNIQKNFIKIGSGGGNNSLNVGDDIKMRASQFVEFNGDFNVPFGASLYIDANKSCTNELKLECSQKFNPCTFDFLNYDNSIKSEIELGEDGCDLMISPVINNIVFDAINQSVLNPGISLIPSAGKFIEIKIVNCPN